MLDVRRLRTLREVALHGTIRAAAESLSFTPSAVSQQLTALEREVGYDLLERRGRSVHLTAAGRVLVERSEPILAQLADAEAEAKAVAGGGEPPIRIASFASAAATIVAEAAAAGRLDAHILECDPRVGLARLKAGEVDVAVLWEYDYVPLRVPETIELVPLLDDPIEVVLPRSHPAARRADVELADLADEPWINSTTASSCHPFLLRACVAAGFEPRIAAETIDHRALHHLVASGVGLAVVPVLSQLDLPASLAAKPIRTSPPKRRIHAAFRRAAAGDARVQLALERLQEASADRRPVLTLVPPAAEMGRAAH
ncbi:MAG TPA: LysR family transcriptional regulator [Gaiellaceae bacterium]|nr:LysR family transcriptional regulator [Gaiellaceae bacterium]